MLAYVYDGTFEGLLTAVYEAYYRGEGPETLVDGREMQANFLDRYVSIDTDPAKADKVFRSIREKISGDALQRAYHVFLSEDSERGRIIYDYLRLGWKMGYRVDLHLSDDRVFRVHQISQRVEYERHKLLGFVRFRQVESGIFYAPIGPDHNIVELLAPHFAERLAGQNWIIHDVKREVAVLYNGREWVVSDFRYDELPAEAGEEETYQRLWKLFFNAIAIESRKNPRLQRQWMPRRYWKYLTEKW